MPLFKSGRSSPTAHFLNSSCAFTLPADVVNVDERVGGFLAAGAAVVDCIVGTTPELTALVVAGGGTAAGVFGFPPAPTVVQAPPGAFDATGEATLPARFA